MNTFRRTKGLSQATTVALVLVVALAGCGRGGDGNDGDSSPPPDTTEPPGSTAPTTEPPGTSPVDVEPYVAELLVRYDEVTNQIVADPGVATDPDHPLVVEYRSLVEPGSVADGAVEVWAGNAGRGVSIRAYDDTAPAYVTALDGEVVTVSADEVTFPTCERANYRKFDAQGRETEFVTGQFTPGTGTAVRVDGEWLLRRMDIAGNVAGCRTGAA
jgi:hypothetical protein